METLRVETLMAFVIGALYALGIYLMLRRSIVKLVIGLALLGNAANLLIFTVGGLTRGRAPVVPTGQETFEAPYADPLPQALILTAIVIGFAVLSFTAVLLKRVHQTVGVDDMDELRATDSL